MSQENEECKTYALVMKAHFKVNGGDQAARNFAIKELIKEGAFNADIKMVDITLTEVFPRGSDEKPRLIKF